jgi:hypothetical protein
MSDQLNKDEIALVDKTIEKYNKLTEITYKKILSNNPPKEIVKHHEFGKFDYLPITAVERMLDGLFEHWSVDILREGVAVNGFYVAVKLKAKIPGSDRILESDGIGFAEFQTQKGAAPTDFTKLSQSAGVMAVPKAKTEAIKNAAKSFGNLFGRNLTRNDDRSEYEDAFVHLSRNKIANTLGASDEAA